MSYRLILLSVLDLMLGLSLLRGRATPQMVDDGKDRAYWIDCLAVALLVYGMDAVTIWACNPYRLWAGNRDYKKIADLEEKFESLTPESKAALVDLEVATKDAVNQITLKYICPISMSLIVHPVYIKVDKDDHNFDFEIYEKFFIQRWLSSNPNKISPLTKRNIVEENDQLIIEDQALINAHADYIKKLAAQFEPKRSFSHIRRLFCCPF